jgi:electron transport complex protein RnfC
MSLLSTLTTFKRGGIHPPEQKITDKSPITPADLPTEAVISLGQHIGAPAQVQVKPGDKVQVGSLLGAAPGLISANIHSSVSGTVKKIEPRMDASGYPKLSVVITVDGDEWIPELEDLSKTSKRSLRREITKSPEEIRDALKTAGIVGMGGATFPTNVKYMVPPGKKAEYLIINAVECEPYLTADHRTMVEYPGEVMVGIEILRKALGVEKALVGIEANKPDAIEIMTRQAADYPAIEVYPLQVKYPQGAEKQLVAALTGREVPSGALPIEVGCVVNNVGTAQAAYLAVQYGLPFIQRVVTVTGKGLKHPGNFLVRLGTPVSQLVEMAGGLPTGDEPVKVVLGGPMMGKAVGTLDIPVSKGTSGVLILHGEEAQRPAVDPCIRCGRCVSVCPMGLEPYLLSQLAAQKRFEESEELKIMDCVECGSCSYTCPSNRDLLDFIRFGKSRIMASRRKGGAK